jgi:hypothetical protein
LWGLTANLACTLNCKVLRRNRRDCGVSVIIMEIVMQLKFVGNYAKLKNCVANTLLDGKWRMLKSGNMQYLTNDGGYLNWRKTTGTITFRGSNSIAKEELTQAFIDVASERRRLLGEFRGRVFHGRLRTLYPE